MIPQPPTQQEIDRLMDDINKAKQQMKIVADNRKKPKQPKESELEEIKLKKSRTPKYIKIGRNKILTPKEIVVVDVKFEDTKGKKYYFYADKRCTGSNISRQMLDDAESKGEVFIVLRIPKSSKGSVFAFSQDLKTVMSYRKMRLATAMSLFAVGEATGQNPQTVEEFIRSEVELEEGLDIEELKKQFLAVEDPALIVKDVRRLIHLYHQETMKNENTAPNKHSKKPK